MNSKWRISAFTQQLFRVRLPKLFQLWVFKKSLKQLKCTCLLAGNAAVFEVTPQEYMPHLGAKMSLHFVVTGKTEDENVSDVKVIYLKPPPLIVQVENLKLNLNPPPTYI